MSENFTPNETGNEIQEFKEISSVLSRKAEVIVYLDSDGEIIGGFAKKEGKLKPLNPCENLFDGNKILKGLSPITMVRVSSSPGFWCPCGRRMCWCPK